MDLLSRLTRLKRRPGRGSVLVAASAVIALTAVFGPVGHASARVSAYSGDTAALSRPAHESCPAGGGTEFSDVPDGNVHSDAIRCVALWQVAQGRSARAYDPGAPVTRAQMASFIFRLIDQSGGDLPAPETGAFRDLSARGTHTAAIEKLAAAEVVEGLADGTYGPDRTVTRAQTASLLVRAFEYRTGTSLPSAEDAFPDDAGSVHEASIDKATAAGFASGRSTGHFAPAAPVRRDQMASFMSRVLDRLVVDGLTPAVDTRLQLCYSTKSDLSDGRSLQGATLRGDVYMYVADRC